MTIDYSPVEQTEPKLKSIKEIYQEEKGTVTLTSCKIKAWLDELTLNIDSDEELQNKIYKYICEKVEKNKSKYRIYPIYVYQAVGKDEYDNLLEIKFPWEFSLIMEYLKRNHSAVVGDKCFECPLLLGSKLRISISNKDANAIDVDFIIAPTRKNCQCNIL